jgi:hypothetical protein
VLENSEFLEYGDSNQDQRAEIRKIGYTYKRVNKNIAKVQFSRTVADNTGFENGVLWESLRTTVLVAKPKPHLSKGRKEIMVESFLQTQFHTYSRLVELIELHL